MRERRGMHHSRATFDRAADRTRVQQVIAVEAVEAGDIVAKTLQVRRYRGTYMTAMTSDQDPHVPMVAECLNQSTGFGHAEYAPKSPISSTSPLVKAYLACPMVRRRSTVRFRKGAPVHRLGSSRYRAFLLLVQQVQQPYRPASTHLTIMIF